MSETPMTPKPLDPIESGRPKDARTFIESLKAEPIFLAFTQKDHDAQLELGALQSTQSGSPAEQFNAIGDWYKSKAQWEHVQVLASEMAAEPGVWDKIDGIIVKANGDLEELAKGANRPSNDQEWVFTKNMVIQDESKRNELKAKAKKELGLTERFRDLADIHQRLVNGDFVSARDLKILTNETTALSGRGKSLLADKKADDETVITQLTNKVTSALESYGGHSRYHNLFQRQIDSVGIWRTIHDKKKNGNAFTELVSWDKLHRELATCQTSEAEEMAKYGGYQREGWKYIYKPGTSGVDNIIGGQPESYFFAETDKNNQLIKDMMGKEPEDAVEHAFKVFLGRETMDGFIGKYSQLGEEIGKNREPVTKPKSMFVDQLKNDGPSAVIRELMDSDEYRHHVVKTLFHDLLGREVDESGHEYYMDRLKKGSNPLELADEIRMSKEYRQINEIRKLVNKQV